MAIQFLEHISTEEIQKRLQKLYHPVSILLFIENENENCSTTEAFLKTLSKLSDGKVNLDVRSTDIPLSSQRKHDVYHVPTLLIETKEGSTIRFTGTPGGYETIALLHTIETLGTYQHSVSDDTLQKLTTIRQPLYIKVFVTPTCPYCPRTVTLVHQLAFLNSNISSEMVEVTEFPDLAERYEVYGVPHIVINENHHFEGNLPETLFMEQVLTAYKKLYSQG
ncbi:MAG: thioredoxin family protein [Bacteroidetes bacterium]|nr:thioredoxin family protein [Bacteroidota bacterium]